MGSNGKVCLIQLFVGNNEDFLMQFKGHAKLIDQCNVVTRITFNEEVQGTKAFLVMKEAIVTPCLQELIDRAAMQLSKAGLVGEHMISFDLVVHAQEVIR